jgi:epoxide hydrolase-like predicted phosphatase
MNDVRSGAARPLTGLLVDWAGVLTAPVVQSTADWARSEGVDLAMHDRVMEVLRAAPVSPVHELERGRITPEEFEQLLAEGFRREGKSVQAAGLLSRMMAGLRDVSPEMVGMLRRARAQGVRTALFSNSWGEHYPEHLWDGAFDVLAISGRLGMRKPEPEIFERAAGLLGLRPDECILIDDLQRNIDAAAKVGMVGVLHRSYDETRDELEVLLGLSLS